MNRYQFEDLISEYIENELSLKKRKEFEAYMKENPEAQQLVDVVQKTMDDMKGISPVSVSHDFNDRLMARVRSEKGPGMHPTSQENTWFGFTPIYASLMTGLVIAFGFISMQLMSFDNPLNPSNQVVAGETIPESSIQIQPHGLKNQSNFAEAEEDSTFEDGKQKTQKDFSNKIHYVND